MTDLLFPGKPSSAVTIGETVDVGELLGAAIELHVEGKTFKNTVEMWDAARQRVTAKRNQQAESIAGDQAEDAKYLAINRELGPEVFGEEFGRARFVDSGGQSLEIKKITCPSCGKRINTKRAGRVLYGARQVTIRDREGLKRLFWQEFSGPNLGMYLMCFNENCYARIMQGHLYPK